MIESKPLVEQHFHGGYGINFNTFKNCDDIIYLAQKLYKASILYFFPTLCTDSFDNLNRQISLLNKVKKKLESIQYTSQIIGIHLEGPFINPLKRGIHDPNLIQNLTIENFDKLNYENVKIVTLSPELDRSGNFLSYLKNKGIKVQAGHTMSLQLDQNIDGITHTFNAMPDLNHKSSNITTKSLINMDIYNEIIPDGKHVNLDILKIFFSVKSKSMVILISDALPISYSQKETMTFCNKKIFLDENNCAVDKQGILAGSTLFLNDMIKIVNGFQILELKDILKMASENIFQYHDISPREIIVFDNCLNPIGIKFEDKFIELN